jgi:TP901 family phage tail tape measure protein
MSEINQKLGFDVSDALAAISSVNTAFDSFDKALATNKANISRYVNDVTRKMNALKSVAGGITFGGAKGAGGGTGAKAAADELKKALPTLREYEMAVRKHVGEATESATRKQKRAYQNAVMAASEYAQKTKMSLKSVDAAWTKSATNLSGQNRMMANKMQTAANTVNAASKSMTKGIGTFTVSWQTMVRVVATQAIVRALSLIRAALRQAISDAIEFGLRIAEIGTIAEGQLGGLQNISAEVIKIAKEFGRPAADVAEGLYQTISNQVGNAEESLHAFIQANKLAVATNTSTADAVALLTAALNGFGLSADHAERVSGILFTTIKQGRLRASELANILGRIAPLYSQMGGSIEEMSAALATMTVTGVKADTAVTQLRAIMIKLLKPSTELTKIFQERWGVENAQEALRMFGGLRGLLAELSKEANGSTQQMSEFFNRVRAVAGVLGLAGDNAKRFAINMEKILAEQAIEDPFMSVMATDAKKAETAMNNLRTAMMELGQELLPLFTTLTQGLATIADNADAIKNALKGVVLVANILVAAKLGIMVAGWATASTTIAGASAVTATAAGATAASTAATVGPAAAVAASSATTAVAATTTATAGAAILAVLGPIAIGLGIGVFLGLQIADSFESSAQAARRLRKEVNDLIEKEMEAVRKKAAEIAEEWAKGLKAMTAAGIKAFSTLQKVQNNTAEDYKIDNKLRADSADHMLDRYVNAWKKAVDHIDQMERQSQAKRQKALTVSGSKVMDQAKKATDLRIKLDKKVEDLREKHSEKRHELARQAATTSANWDIAIGQERFNQSISRLKDGVYKANKILKNAQQLADPRGGTAESKKASLDLAAAEARRAMSMAQSAGSMWTANKAGKTLLNIMEQQKDLDMAAEAEKRAKFEEKAAAESQKLIDANNAAMEKQTAAFVKAVKSLREVFKEPVKMNYDETYQKLQKAIKLADVVRKGFAATEDGVAKTSAQKATDLEAARTALKGLITLSKSVDIGFDTIEGFQSSLDQFADKYAVSINAELNADEAQFKTNIEAAFREVPAEMRTMVDEIFAALGKEPIKWDPANFLNQYKDALTQIEAEYEGSGKKFIGIQAGITGKTKVAIGEMGKFYDSLDKEMGKLEKNTGNTSPAINAIIEKLSQSKSQYTSIQKQAEEKPIEFWSKEGKDQIRVYKENLKELLDMVSEWRTAVKDATGSDTPSLYVPTGPSMFDFETVPLDKIITDLTSAYDGFNAIFQNLTKLNENNDVEKWATVETNMEKIQTYSTTAKAKWKLAADSGGVFKTAMVDSTKPMTTVATQSVTLAGGMERGETAAEGFHNWMEKASRLQQPDIPTPGAATVNQSKGGMISYFANGGFARKGTDTVPAMLSPGEYVVNARSTRKFYSQLVAMNSGRQPIYRSEGGPVTNVGDINISVTGGTTDRESARNIVTRVRRELRRRSSTLG